MQKIYEIRAENIASFSDVMTALEKAATAHAVDLQIDFPRMLHDFGALWMIVRSRLVLNRMPKGEILVKTWLRQPKTAVSNRDFALFADGEEIGYAVQSWVLADASARSIISMKNIPPLWSLPTVQPERTEVLKRISMPELTQVETWEVQPQELDLNGHLNNVQYIRRAEKYAPEGATSLDVIFDHECFAGEILTLQANDGYVQGVKPDGAVSFRAHFYKGEPQ